jgi:hypothetical protein
MGFKKSTLESLARLIIKPGRLPVMTGEDLPTWNESKGFISAIECP